MVVTFVNRQEELSLLERLYESGRPHLVLVYGRRRVGKTRLLVEFLKNRNGLYFYVPSGSEALILSELSKPLEEEFFKGFRFPDFRAFLEYLAERASRERLVVVIDEFQRLVEIKGSITLLQRYWDETLSKSKIFLILCGSTIGMIERIAIRGEAPLYGRRTATLNLKPLKFSALKEWFKKYSLEDLVKVYGAFGGTPAYLEHVDESITVEENIVGKILNKNSPLYNEPEFLLMEELRYPHRYFEILHAISIGKNSLNEISNQTRIRRENLTTYLKSLMEMELISRIYPVLHRGRRGLYLINDLFLSFWFRYVYPNKRMLELGFENSVWKSIRNDFNNYLGRVFERISEEFISDKFRKGELPLSAGILGKWWFDGEEIDIVVFSSEEKEAILIEVKWTEITSKDAERIIRQLMRKSTLIPEVSQAYYGVIAKKILGKRELLGKGFLCFDLEDF